MTTVTGPREAWFLEFYPSCAGVEETMALGDKQPAKSELAQLNVQDAESISGTRIMLATFEKDLSFMPERPLGKVHFVSMQIERVRMGRGAEQFKLRAMSNAGRSAGGHKGRQLVYRVTSGAPFGTYVVLRALESLKDLNPNPSVRPLPQAMGAERYNELRKLFGETMMSSETVIFAVSPAMSYLAKEMKDVDPSFWTVPQPADG